MHWIVRIYDEDNVVTDWVISDRTEHEASREAESEVEQHHPGLDWTLSPLAHTPGPWFHDDEFCIGTKGGGNTIAMTGQDPQLSRAEHEVNARMIAALPLLDSYRDYVERNLERIERGGWTPVCFAEFCESDEAAID